MTLRINSKKNNEHKRKLLIQLWDQLIKSI